MNKVAKAYYKTRFALTRTNKAFQSFGAEISRKESSLKGRIFEDYVRKYIFPKEYFKLEHRTPDFNPEDYDHSLNFPDFILSDASGIIGIEVKYRKGAYGKDSTLSFARSEKQLDNYKSFARNFNISVLIVVGVGRSPYNPKEIYLLNVEQVYNHKLPIKHLSNNRIQNKTAITPSHIKVLLNTKIKHGGYAVFT